MVSGLSPEYPKRVGILMVRNQRNPVDPPPNMSHLPHLPAAAATATAAAATATAAAAGEELLPSPRRGSELRDEDVPQVQIPCRGCDGRQRVRASKSRPLRAAAQEDGEAVASLGGAHREQDVPVTQFHRRSSDGTAAGGEFMAAAPVENMCEDDLDSTASTPPSPVVARSCNHLTATIERTSRMVKIRTLENRGQTKEVDKQPKSTSTKSSPVKITKHLQIKRRQGSRASSDVWDHFTPHETEDGPVAVCNYCDQVYTCDRAYHGTSTLRRHVMNLCMSSPFWDPEKRRKTAEQHEYHFSIEDCRKALRKMVILDEMPFKVVEGEGFREYSKTLEPRFELPSRFTVARDCMKVYLEEKTKLRKSLTGHRICLTTDTWTSNQNLNYMSLTGHWVDENWKLQERVLNFCVVPDHKGETLGEKIEECLLEWDIGNILTITVDNASSNNTAISHMKTISKDWQGVILENEFLHIRCSAHIVNLIVKSGLKFISSSVTKIRNDVLYVRSSPGRLVQFRKCVEKEKISERSLLSLDVETRWNATYLMLESAVKFEKAFFRLAKDKKSYYDHFGANGIPDAVDWAYAKEFLSVMKPFCDVTVRLSGSQYVTSSTFFHDFITIHDKLDKLSRINNPAWSMMAVQMKKKFDKYWGNISTMNPLLFMAVALDPRFKLKFIEFSSKILYDKVKAKEFCSIIESGLSRLYDCYVEVAAGTSSSGARNNYHELPIDTEEHAEDISDSLVSQFAIHLKEIETREINSELSRYLKDNCEKNTGQFDILNWWKVNSGKYPVLSKVAKDVLAVQVSTVASESAFSNSGRVVSPFRSSLSPNMVEALVCGQSWLRSSRKNVDLEEIIRDLKNCEALEEELAELNCGN